MYDTVPYRTVHFNNFLGFHENTVIFFMFRKTKRSDHEVRHVVGPPCIHLLKEKKFVELEEMIKIELKNREERRLEMIEVSSTSADIDRRIFIFENLQEVRDYGVSVKEMIWFK